MRFVITGTGRCGTMWAAETLRACGIRCGHQDVLRHEHTLGRAWSWGEYEGEASYEAAPLLPQLAEIGEVRVVALVRDPLDTIGSWLSLGLFTDRIDTWERWGLLSRVLDHYCPDVLGHDDPVGRAALFWVRWLGLALPYAHAALRVEDADAHALLAAVGMTDRYRQVAELVPRDTNHRREDKAGRWHVSWDDIPSGVRGEVAHIAEALGYEVAR